MSVSTIVRISEKLSEVESLLKRISEYSSKNKVDISRDAVYIALQAQSSILRDLISEMRKDVETGRGTGRGRLP